MHRIRHKRSDGQNGRREEHALVVRVSRDKQRSPLPNETVLSVVVGEQYHYAYSTEDDDRDQPPHGRHFVLGRTWLCKTAPFKNFF